MPQRKEECTNPLSENKFLYGIMSVKNISLDVTLMVGWVKLWLAFWQYYVLGFIVALWKLSAVFEFSASVLFLSLACVLR